MANTNIDLKVRAVRKDEDGNIVGNEMIPLPPAVATPLSVAADAPITLKGSLGTGLGSLVQDLTAGQKMVCIVAGAYPVVWRFRAAGDSNGITNLSGLYPYKDKLPSGKQYIPVPVTATSIILDYVTSDTAITVIGY